MKKFLLFLLFVISCCLANAKVSLRPKVYLGKFGIEKQNTIEAYQKYVGSIVVYLSGETTASEYIDSEGFIKAGGSIDKEYVITKISEKDEQLIFVLKEKEGKKKIKLQVNTKETFIQSSYCITHNYTFPLLLVDKLKEAKKEYIGQSFSFYEISDVVPIRLNNDYKEDHYPRIHLKITNKKDNSVKYIEMNDIALVEKAISYMGKKYSFLNKRIEIPGLDKSKNVDNPLFYEIIDFSIEKKPNYYTNKIESQLILKLQHNLDKSVEYSRPIELDLYNDLGKTFANSKFKHYYQVVKVLNNRKVEYVVRNSVTGKEKTISKENAHLTVFADDLSGSFNAVLSKVEKPANQSIRYGKTITFTDKGVNKYNYKDNVIDIVIVALSEQFLFTINNLSTSTIKIIWDDAAFIDTDGSTSKIIHKGIKYIQREESQPPTSIIKNAKLEDVAVPTNKIYFSSVSNEWDKRSLFSNVNRNGDNQKIKLMLPIEIKGITNEYIFEFTVKYIYDNPELIRM